MSRLSVRAPRVNNYRSVSEWGFLALVVLLVLGIAVFGVFNLIWWRECVDAGGVYINGDGVLPSCLRGF